MTVTIGRRKLLVALGGAAVAWPLAARAQQAERMRRIGVLLASTADDPEYKPRMRAFEQALALRAEWNSASAVNSGSAARDHATALG